MSLNPAGPVMVCEALKALLVAYQKDGKASPAGAGWEDAVQNLGENYGFQSELILLLFGVFVWWWHHKVPRNFTHKSQGARVQPRRTQMANLLMPCSSASATLLDLWHQKYDARPNILLRLWRVSSDVGPCWKIMKGRPAGRDSWFP